MNITKSHLRRIINEEINKVLLQEAAKGPGDLPEDISVVITTGVVWQGSHRIRIFYAKQCEPERHAMPHHDKKCRLGWFRDDSVEPYGQVIIAKSREGTCGNAWKVQSAGADNGWGPLLYDVAMEWATLNGGGLMADRQSVSNDAREVWDYFLQKRSDVTPHQLDNLENELTPDIEDDNCNQRTAEWNDWAIDPEDMDMKDRWAESALSKRYTKEPATMQELESMGKLIEQ